MDGIGLIIGRDLSIGGGGHGRHLAFAKDGIAQNAAFGPDVILAVAGIKCRQFGRRYLKAIVVTEDVDLLECVSPYDDAAGLLFDTHCADLPGGTGQVFDWGRLSTDVRRRLSPPLILSGGLDAGNVGRAIREVGPWAVDVSSGVEQRDSAGKPLRGLKDALRIAAFVEGVRIADRAS